MVKAAINLAQLPLMWQTYGPLLAHFVTFLCLLLVVLCSRRERRSFQRLVEAQNRLITALQAKQNIQRKEATAPGSSLTHRERRYLNFAALPDRPFLQPMKDVRPKHKKTEKEASNG